MKHREGVVEKLKSKLGLSQKKMTMEELEA